MEIKNLDKMAKKLGIETSPKSAIPNKPSPNKGSGNSRPNNYNSNNINNRPANNNFSANANANAGAVKFTNPYNFAETSDIEVRSKIRPHTDHEGMISGRITCELKTLTPMAAGGNITEQPYDKGPQNKKFKHLNHFKYNGNLAIPAATLKGMTRNVFETVTNSCMMHYDETNFEGYRTTQGASSEIEVGIVIELPTADSEGRVQLCDKYLVIEEILKQNNIISTKFKTEKVYVAVDKKRKRVVSISKSSNNSMEEAYLYTSGKMTTPRMGPILESDLNNEILDKLKNTNQLTVYYDRRKLNPGEKNNPSSPNFIINISTRPSYLYSGTLKKENDYRSNQIVYNLYSNKKSVVGVPLKGQYVTLNDFEVKKYMHVFRHGERAGCGELKLKKGDLIFFKVENDSVKNIIRASLGRIAFEKSISEILTNSEVPCYIYNFKKKLHDMEQIICPACQVFGYTEDSRQTKNNKKTFAFAGRVFFSHAINTSKNQTSWEILKTAGAPHPSTTFFYIKTKDEKLSATKTTRNGPVEAMPDINSSARIRGRKFYVKHQNVSEKNYKGILTENSDRQNTIIELIKEPATFKFTIDFEKLTGYELGALLYSLQLDKEMCHSIGHAKPFGLGDCLITIGKLEIDTPARYETLDTSKWTETINDYQKYIDSFQSQRIELENTGKNKVNSFNEIAGIKSLKSIRNINGTSEVKYPEERKGNNDPKGFQWFVEHANYNHTGRDFTPQPLPLAKDIKTKKLNHR
ncbi:MAG: TIGR03986 family CRISPR-associated RAMP protein [Candidatus Wallbacteria bacterium]